MVNGEEIRLGALARRELPHIVETVTNLATGEVHLRPVFDEPVHAVVRAKHFGPGRVELVGKFVDVQRIANAAVSPRRPVGPRVKPDQQDPENIARAVKRAQSTVRELCLKMGADRLLTFGTRKVIPVRELYERFVRFREAYAREIKRLRGDDSYRWLFVAVPERHPTNPDHFHLHVAATGFFELSIALPVWHALCASDFDDGEKQSDRHGSINVRAFRARNPGGDVPSIIAGYIAKYVGKSFGSEFFNSRRFWSAQLGERRTTYVLCQARTLDELIPEICERFRLDLANLVLCHEGAWFIPSAENMVWFKLTPQTYRGRCPF